MSRALLIHSGALGDFVLALRLFCLLRGHVAQSLTTLTTAEHGRLAIAGNAADAALDLDQLPLHALFGAAADAPPESLVRALRGFDLTINMLAGGPHGLRGERLAPLTGGRIFDLDPRPRDGEAVHIMEQWHGDLRRAGLALPPLPGFDAPESSCARPSGRSSRSDSPLLQISMAQRRAARRSFFEVDSPGCRCVVLHPGAGSPAKCWPLSSFVELARVLAAEGCRARMALGPVERDRWTAAELAAAGRAAPPLPPFARDDLLHALAAADFVIGHDSGIAHLAAALGVPTAVLFRATDPRRWRPPGQHVLTFGGAGNGALAGADGAWPADWTPRLLEWLRRAAQAEE